MKTTIPNILNLIRAGKNDPTIRETAVEVLQSQGLSAMDYERVFEAMLEFVRQNVMFVRDPTKEDVCFEPKHTLGLGYADCEDQSILLSSLLESIGLPTKLVIISKHGPVWDHAYIQAGYPPDNPREWVALDSTIPGPAGNEVQYAKQKLFKVS